MPAKIVVTQYISLDGVIEDPVGMEESGLGDWTGPFTRGPEGDAFKHRELAESAALLFGRSTYDAFAAVWPAVDDPEGYAKRINALPKFVASSTFVRPAWNNSTVLQHDTFDQVRRLKRQIDGTILVFGSAVLVHGLFAEGLVDEMTMMVYPTVLGRGKRLFPEGFSARLALIESRPFGDGILLMRYAAA